MTEEQRLAAQGQLLNEVFPGTGVGDTTYLRWLYVDSPFGPATCADHQDENGLSGHYALVPFTIQCATIRVRGAVSLNTAVHPRARGGGVFVELAERAFERGRADGIRYVVGVANANSTPGFLRRLRFQHLGPLPVRILVRWPSLWHRADAPSATDTHALEEAVDLLNPTTTTWYRSWTPEELRWRLAAPGTEYVLHRVGKAVAVSTLERRGPVRIAVILAIFAKDRLSRRESGALVREICRRHRAAIALHAGYNDHFPLTGVPLPPRMRPSPLNLIARHLDRGPELPRPSRFEFLDFDAY